MSVKISATDAALLGFLTRGDAPPVQIFEMNLRRVGTTPDEREAYLRYAPWKGDKEGTTEDQFTIAELIGSGH